MRDDDEDFDGGSKRGRERPRDKTPPLEKLKPMVIDYLNSRFGLDEGIFEGYGFYLASKGRVYLGPKRTIDRPRIVTVGLLIARVTDAVKPSTNLLQAMGRLIKKNRIELTKEQTLSYAKGEDVMFKEAPKGATEGYVLLSYLENPLGCGHLKNKTIKNMLPKAKRLEIKHL
ncbi:MAG: hypothetical protein V1827_06410 [Candidatus Micrarchaeota archaeon]